MASRTLESRFVTKSLQGTSSFARASSSRWSWSSSSSPARTKNGISAGSTSAWTWFTDLGIDPAHLRLFEHPKDKLSHYSKRTVDIEYRFNVGGEEFSELEGIANRTDFDLRTHGEASGQDLSFLEQDTKERWFPYVIEPAVGVNRSMLAFLMDAYDEDEAPNAKGGVDKRTGLAAGRATSAGEGCGAAAVT